MSLKNPSDLGCREVPSPTQDLHPQTPKRLTAYRSTWNTQMLIRLQVERCFKRRTPGFPSLWSVAARRCAPESVARENCVLVQDSTDQPTQHQNLASRSAIILNTDLAKLPAKKI